MGKRKKSSRKPQGPKKKEPLATNFPCLFCNHENSITVKLDKKGGIGELSCKVCGQSFQSGINYLSAAVDVYSDWVDACESVAKDGRDPADGLGSYGDVGDDVGGERGSETRYDRHAMTAGDENAAEYDDDG